MNRRDLLANLAKATAVLVPAVPALALGLDDKGGAACSKPPGGPGANYFPNVPVIDQDGVRALFYRDLVRGKVVIMHFTSVAFNKTYPVMQNLAGLQKLIGSHLGNDVFMYTITFDPDHDTPPTLKEFAQSFGAKPGWSFLTGKRPDLEAIRTRLFQMSDGSSHGSHCGGDCSRGIVRIGNEALGRWTGCPSRCRPEVMAHYLQFMGLKTPLPHLMHGVAQG
jgi:protein SCO1/2